MEWVAGKQGYHKIYHDNIEKYRPSYSYIWNWFNTVPTNMIVSFQRLLRIDFNINWLVKIKILGVPLSSFCMDLLF